MQPKDELSAWDVIRNALYMQECFKVSVDLFNILKNAGVDAYIAWVDGYFNDDGTVGRHGHVWVVMNVLGVMIPLETQPLAIPSRFLDYLDPDMVTNDMEVIMKEHNINLTRTG